MNSGGPPRRGWTAIGRIGLTPIANWFSRHRLEWGLGLRMTAAGLLSFAAANLLSVRHDYWAVLTAVIVTQSSLGGSLKAVVDRFAGTLGGAFWGVAVTLLLPYGSIATTALALAVALVPLSLLVAFRPAYRVAPVTAVIVLLARFGPGGALEAGFDRVIEIGLGSVVALAVAWLVPPARAHALLLGAARDALALMAEQTGTVLAGIAAPVDAARIRTGSDRIRAAIERAATIGDEAARERRSYVTGAPDPDPLVRAVRRLGNDLTMLARSLRQPLPETVAARLAPPGAAVAEAIAAYLGGIGAALAQDGVTPAADRIDRAFAEYDASMAGLRRDGLTRSLADDDVEHVFGLAFALEQTRGNLAELAGRAGELLTLKAIG